MEQEPRDRANYRRSRRKASLRATQEGAVGPQRCSVPIRCAVATGLAVPVRSCPPCSRDSMGHVGAG